MFACRTVEKQLTGRLSMYDVRPDRRVVFSLILQVVFLFDHLFPERPGMTPTTSTSTARGYNTSYFFINLLIFLSASRYIQPALIAPPLIRR